MDPNSVNSNNAKSSQSKNNGGTVAVVVIVLVLVFAVGGYLLVGEERRARLTMCFKGAKTAPSFTYSKLSDLESGDQRETRNLFDDDSDDSEDDDDENLLA